jgi:hypothetical protein
MITSTEIAVLPNNVLHGLSTMATGSHQTTPDAVYAARREFKDLAARELFQRGEAREDQHGSQ